MRRGRAYLTDVLPIILASRNRTFPDTQDIEDSATVSLGHRAVLAVRLPAKRPQAGGNTPVSSRFRLISRRKGWLFLPQLYTQGRKKRSGRHRSMGRGIFSFNGRQASLEIG